jgi:hypothetical protein
VSPTPPLAGDIGDTNRCVRYASLITTSVRSPASVQHHVNRCVHVSLSGQPVAAHRA